jgi:hypothetical protein
MGIEGCGGQEEEWRGKRKEKEGRKRNRREKKEGKDRKKQSCAGEEAVVWWDLGEEKVKTEMGSRLDLLGDGRRCSTDMRWWRKSLAEFSTQSLTTTRHFPCNQLTLISPELIFKFIYTTRELIMVRLIFGPAAD